MLRTLSLLFFILSIISCNNAPQVSTTTAKGKDSLYRFYDFDVDMVIWHPNGYVTSRFLLLNSGMEYYDEQNDKLLDNHSFKPNTLYSISYEQLQGKAVAKDTISTSLQKEQIDSIYTQTIKIFDIEPKVNLSKDSIPLPPANWDGKNAQVYFSLGFRGNHYRASGRADEDGSDRTSQLYQLLLQLKTSR